MSIIATRAAPARATSFKNQFIKPLLKFGYGNAKLKGIFTFSLPAGHTCPNAKLCLSKANKETGKIKDGRQTVFRCYAASMEGRLTSVRDAHWHNLNLLRECGGKREMARLILDSLSPYAGYVRIHDSGDFFNRTYFAAWMVVAKKRPHTHFYAYTKALPFWVEKKKFLPTNLVLVASIGGTHDHLIQEYSLRYSQVVYSEEEAKAAGLNIDHDDSLAMDPSVKAFALLIHGTQPEGSEAGKALSRLRRESGWYGYGHKADVASRRFALQIAGE